MKFTKYLIIFILLQFHKLNSQTPLPSISTNYNEFFHFQSANDYWIASCGEGWKHVAGRSKKDFLLNQQGLAGSFIQSHLYPSSKGTLFSTTYEYLTAYLPADDLFTSCQIASDTHIYKTNYKIIEIDSLRQCLLMTADDDIFYYNYITHRIDEKITGSNLSVRFDTDDDNNTIIGVLWLFGSGIQVYTKKSNNSWTTKRLLEKVRWKNQWIEPNFTNVKIIGNHAYLASIYGILKVNISDFTHSWIYIEGNSTSLYEIEKTKHGLLISNIDKGLLLYNTIENSIRQLFAEQNIGGLKKTGFISTIYTNSNDQILITCKKKEHPILYNFNKIINLDLQLIRKNVQAFNYHDRVLVTSDGGSLSLLAGKEKLVKDVSKSIESIVNFKNYIFLQSDEVFKFGDIKSQHFKNVEVNQNEVFGLPTLTPDTLYIPGLTTIHKFYINQGKLKSESTIKTSEFVKHIVKIDDKIYPINATGGVKGIKHTHQNPGVVHNVEYINTDSSLICSVNGIFIMQESGIEPLIKHEILNFKNVYSAIKDGDAIWFNSENGIYYFNPNKNILYQIPLPPDIVCDNKKISIFNGRVNFTAEKNLYSFDKNIVLSLDEQADVRIDSIMLDKKQVDYKKDYINVGASTKLVEFAVSGKNPIDAKAYPVYYKSDFTTNFYQPISDGKLQLYNLKPGLHHIEFAVLSGNLFKQTTLKITLDIKSPLWQRPWFLLLSALLLTVTGAYIQKKINENRIKLKQAELDKLIANQKLRVQISQDLHDEVGSILSAISMITHNTDIAKEANSAHKKLKQVESKSREALEGMQDIVWSFNPANDQLDKLLLKISGFAVEMCDAANITLELDNNIFEKDLNINLPLELRKDIYLTLKELFNNIAKYSKSKKIKFTSKLQNQELSFILQDDGIPFDFKNALSERKGNGLTNINTRILTHHGNIYSERTDSNNVLIITVPIM
jgi:signal transduction histidine kinase